MRADVTYGADRALCGSAQDNREAEQHNAFHCPGRGSALSQPTYKNPYSEALFAGCSSVIRSVRMEGAE